MPFYSQMMAAYGPIDLHQFSAYTNTHAHIHTHFPHASSNCESYTIPFFAVRFTAETQQGPIWRLQRVRMMGEEIHLDAA